MAEPSPQCGGRGCSNTGTMIERVSWKDFADYPSDALEWNPEHESHQDFLDIMSDLAQDVNERLMQGEIEIGPFCCSKCKTPYCGECDDSSLFYYEPEQHIFELDGGFYEFECRKCVEDDWNNRESKLWGWRFEIYCPICLDGIDLVKPEKTASGVSALCNNCSIRYSFCSKCKQGSPESVEQCNYCE